MDTPKPNNLNKYEDAHQLFTLVKEDLAIQDVYLLKEVALSLFTPPYVFSYYISSLEMGLGKYSNIFTSASDHDGTHPFLDSILFAVKKVRDQIVQYGFDLISVRGLGFVLVKDGTPLVPFEDGLRAGFQSYLNSRVHAMVSENLEFFEFDPPIKVISTQFIPVNSSNIVIPSIRVGSTCKYPYLVKRSGREAVMFISQLQIRILEVMGVAGGYLQEGMLLRAGIDIDESSVGRAISDINDSFYRSGIFSGNRTIRTFSKNSIGYSFGGKKDRRLSLNRLFNLRNNEIRGYKKVSGGYLLDLFFQIFEYDEEYSKIPDLLPRVAGATGEFFKVVRIVNKSGDNQVLLEVGAEEVLLLESLLGHPEEDIFASVLSFRTNCNGDLHLKVESWGRFLGRLVETGLIKEKGRAKYGYSFSVPFNIKPTVIIES